MYLRLRNSVVKKLYGDPYESSFSDPGDPNLLFVADTDASSQVLDIKNLGYSFIRKYGNPSRFRLGGQKGFGFR
jgi:hypothetical protein